MSFLDNPAMSPRRNGRILKILSFSLVAAIVPWEDGPRQQTSPAMHRPWGSVRLRFNSVLRPVSSLEWTLAVVQKGKTGEVGSATKGRCG